MYKMYKNPISISGIVSRVPMDLRFVNKDYELDLGDFSDRLNETIFDS